MQQQELSNVRLDELRGSTVYDDAGEKIGSVEEIFYDPATSRPEWVGIGTGLLGTKRVLVPVEGSRVTDDGLVVSYPKDHVKAGPDVDEDELTVEHEQQLIAHYGLSGPQQAGQQPTGTADADQAMTRSEEEIEVGSRPVETGSARLRKWVETEPVALDVELRREVAQVTREPIDQPVGDHEFGEDEIEVPLSAEKPVVQKQAVAKERIGLQKDVETETQTVQGEVRKERVEVEGDIDGAS
jgi:uncharacterized protein (TIGR02271 family)